MKKKLFNNKGSTMLILVIAIAVISLLGTSILAVTMMNYKIKLANTEMKEAFYLSESGLDKAYEKAYDLIVKAVQKADEKADSFVDDFDADRMFELIEEGQTTGDFTYLLPKIPGEGIVYSYDENAIQDEAKDLFEQEYKDLILGEGYYTSEDDIADVLKKASEGDTLKVIVTNEESLEFTDNSMIVGIESEYISEKETKKTTAVNLIVDVPKYNESYTVETKTVDVNPFWLKVLAAGNLNINNSSTFNGDVFVEENLNVNSAGINPEFKNNLAVRGYTGTADEYDENKGIILNTNSTTYVNNVYAKNILLTGSGAKFRAESGNAQIYVRDDMEINNSNQIVYIDGSYYGFSDGGLSSGYHDRSSGININDITGLRFTITKNMYLHGTSYVNVSNSLKYQTGESFSVKGNYRAYLQPLLEYAPSDGGADLRYVEFEDYEHLRLADHLSGGGTFTAMHKADYIYYYHNRDYGDLTIPEYVNIGGTILTLGSYINGGNLKASVYTIPDRDIFTGFRKEYEKETGGLGYTTDINNGNSIGVLKFSEEIKYINLIEDDDPLNFIYINSGGGSLTLDKVKYKGLIITNGHVIIDPGVESFEGAIISSGTVTIQGGQPKTFRYNKNLVSTIIADNDLHTTVFKDSVSVGELNITTFTTEDGEGGNIDFTNLLNFRNWQIK